jgi:hypothetical protein
MLWFGLRVPTRFTRPHRSTIVPAMLIERESVHFRILERLCQAPKAVRGTSGAMLDRHYNARWAVDELARAGLITERGWHNGPGAVWLPTAEGVAAFERLAARAADGEIAVDPGGIGPRGAESLGRNADVAERIEQQPSGGTSCRELKTP